MPQAGILGRFEYRELEHGWVLDIGGQLERYDMISGHLMDDQVPTIEATRVELVERVNSTLRRHNFRTVIPEIVPGTRQVFDIMEDILDEMRMRLTSGHVACMLIGAANWYLGMALTLGEDHYGAVEMEKLARNRIANLDIRCEDLGINGDALFLSLRETECDGQSVRRLLRGMGKPMVILSVSADPRNTPHLRLGEEHRVLEQTIRASQIRDGYKLETLQSCRPRDIGPALRLHKPSIVHFSGHGASQGLCVEDDNGSMHLLDVTALATLFRQATKELGLKGVVMNACYSETQAEIIANAVGSVIAMEGPVSDNAAIQFTGSFYGCLGDGLSFERAYEWAIAETGLDKTHGRLRPHLITSTIQPPRSRGHTPQPPPQRPLLTADTTPAPSGLGSSPTAAPRPQLLAAGTNSATAGLGLSPTSEFTPSPSAALLSPSSHSLNRKVSPPPPPKKDGLRGNRVGVA